MQKPVIKSTKRHPAAHGGGVRGDNSTPRSSLFEGLFGRMFRSLPAAAWTKEALAKLGTQMTSDPELDPKGLPAAAPETKDRIQDDEENAGISAGYTYLGQFIDHDITFDPASSLQQKNDPDALVDFRTPRLDLDNLYGSGPADQPYLFLPDGVHLALGRDLTRGGKPSKAKDLPRFNKRALIGDKRNDENVIVSQLQGVFLNFHNAVADEMLKQSPTVTFDDIQRMVRWHYQWVVLHDFLPTIVGPQTLHKVLPHLKNGTSIYKDKPELNFFNWRNDPFMPIEFAAAAYRFGHSMVRPIYRLITE